MIDISAIHPVVLFEDDDLLILDKPAGLVVNRADTITAPVLQDWLAAQVEKWQKQWTNGRWQDMVPSEFQSTFGTPEEIFQERIGLAHRLDKDTSGCLVIAKNPGSLVHLLQQFRLRQIQKTYTCLVHGGFAVEEGVISAPLARASYNRMRFAVSPDGRAALTTYKVTQRFVGFKGLVPAEKWGASPQDPTVGEYQKTLMELPITTQKILRQQKTSYEQGFSLVECQPKTGRTHQIRVHLAHIHHPLVGDEVYTGKKRAGLDALWCSRQFLHASHIKLTHPRTQQLLTCTSPLPNDLLTAVRWLIPA